MAKVIATGMNNQNKYVRLIAVNDNTNVIYNNSDSSKYREYTTSVKAYNSAFWHRSSNTQYLMTLLLDRSDTIKWQTSSDNVNWTDSVSNNFNALYTNVYSLGNSTTVDGYYVLNFALNGWVSMTTDIPVFETGSEYNDYMSNVYVSSSWEYLDNLSGLTGSPGSSSGTNSTWENALYQLNNGNDFYQLYDSGDYCIDGSWNRFFNGRDDHTIKIIQLDWGLTIQYGSETVGGCMVSWNDGGTSRSQGFGSIHGKYGIRFAINHDLQEALLIVLWCFTNPGWYTTIMNGGQSNDHTNRNSLYNLLMNGIPSSVTEAGAGSGYIGNSLLSNKKMVGYNVPTSSDTATKTETINEYSETPVSGKPKAGNGYVKITFLRDT